MPCVLQRGCVCVQTVVCVCVFSEPWWVASPAEQPHVFQPLSGNREKIMPPRQRLDADDLADVAETLPTLRAAIAALNVHADAPVFDDEADEGWLGKLTSWI